MNPKVVLQWIYQKLISYNLFLLNEDDYEDDDNAHYIQDPRIVLKYQKYKTWLYVILFTVCLYVLFFVTLMKIESQTVIITKITPETFLQLNSEHSETLSCPCSTVTIPYKNFVSNEITMHPVCSSGFVDQQWIQAIYFEDASRYGVWDFRTSAYSQFELLFKLCTLCQDVITQTIDDINNTELIAIELLSEAQIRQEVNAIIAFEKISASSRMTTLLNYTRTTIQGNFFVSALETNWIIGTEYSFDGYSPFLIAMQVSLQVPNWETMLCGQGIASIEATLPPLSNDSIDYLRRAEMTPLDNSTIVHGFFVGCTPLEALLQSTLNCLYDLECLDLLFDYFPNLYSTNFTPSNLRLTSQYENMSVADNLNRLFATNWSWNLNYSRYFDQCSPSMCTYTITTRTVLSYAITLFISLYGGLIIILRLISSHIIDLLVKYANRANNTGELKLVERIKRLNLFKKAAERTEEAIKRQRIITRFYLISLIGSICILCLFTSLASETMTKIVSKPSLSTYNSLESIYSATLRCPCSKKAIPYQIFLTTSLRFHQICSSGFVQNDWIKILRNSGFSITESDWSNNVGTEFRVLSDFCQLANKTIEDATNRFLSQVYIASFAMNQHDFHRELSSIAKQFYQSTLYNFNSLKNFQQLIIQVDQFYQGSIQASFIFYYNGLTVNIITDEISNRQTAKMQFVLNEIQPINSTMATCVCAVDPSCHSSAVLYNRSPDYSLMYTVPGWSKGCSGMDSLRLSTLQCLYPESNPDCFPLFLSVIYKVSEVFLYLESSSLQIEPLIYDSTISRYPPNTSMSVIFDEMMLEQWNISASYELFYESCAPAYCSFSERIRKENFIEVVITLISMIGGIVISLRLITPYLANFILDFWIASGKKPKKPKQAHQSCLDRLKTLVDTFVALLRNTILNLNIFTVHDFGSHDDRATVKRHGQWATRLFFILFLGSLILLISYTTIQPTTITKTYDRPLFTFYKHLIEIHGDELECTCSNIASSFDRFVNIEPVFHSICSSKFIFDEWRVELTNGLDHNLTAYEQRDYRRFLSAHLQYLRGLCQFSQQSVNNSVNEFLTSLLVTSELLSLNNFYDRLNRSIVKTKLNAPVLFSRLLFVIRSINHGNAFISTYGTNFLYIPEPEENSFEYTPTTTVTYDNNCSCGLFSNCTTQANFIEANSMRKYPIKGMKMGCTPSESLLASTLECFYDQSCLDLIRRYTNCPNSSVPLSINNSRFLQNTTIDQLAHDLFLEKWSTQVDYPSYYEHCSPSICSYARIERFNVLYTITIILGLQGGLTIALKWICPKLVRIASKIYQNRKKQASSVRPSSHVMTNTITIRPETTTSLSVRSYAKIISGVVVLSCSIACIIIFFSIYYAGQNSATTSLPSTGSFSVTMSTTITPSSSAPEPVCSFQFKQISTGTRCLVSSLIPSIIVDLNDDGRTDLIMYCDSTKTVDVLLGTGNGTFHEVSKFPLGNHTAIRFIRTADTNNDGRLDLIVAYDVFLPSDFLHSVRYILILFGYGNGTFQTTNIQSLTLTGFLVDISVVDVNEDHNVDIVYLFQLDDYVYVRWGDGNGTFSSQLMLFTSFNSNLRQLAIADYNHDNHIDIAVMNSRSLHIHLYLSDTEGGFQAQKRIYTAFDISSFVMLIGDFDHRNQSNIILVHQWKNTGYLLYRYDNGTFTVDDQIMFNEPVELHSVIVGDLNNDKHLDIIIGGVYPYRVHGFFGNGNGYYQFQMIDSSNADIYEIWLGIDDFNNDYCQDLIKMSVGSRTIDVLLNTCQCSTT
ncbi:unnamed protein product [Adineta ricciae]|uniref:Uncharacterized protein n=1 Tax=Adineta ricciae TaxID=249248 RepID=A0A814TTN0_ADIRI|nr:unnamed protein product [Adineta ricciae]